ncbi:MAG: hypothetical protein GYA55_12880, partial [SAR324 cluster bacterium]|nr:hypothetical protein [SAR324 cluster bacterium]
MLPSKESKLNREARKKNEGEGSKESVNPLSSFLSKLGDEILVSDLQTLAPGHFVRVPNITPKIPDGIPVVGIVTKNLNGDARRLLVACLGLDTERAFTYSFLRYATIPLSTFQFVLQADRVTEMADALMKGNIEAALSILPDTTQLNAAKEFFALNVLPAILEVRSQAENQRDWSHVNIYEIKRLKGYYQACNQFGKGPKDWKGLLINGSRFFRYSLGGELSQEEIESIVKATEVRIRELKRRAQLVYTSDALEELRAELKMRWSKAVTDYQTLRSNKEPNKSAFSEFSSENLMKHRGILALSINPQTGRSDINYLLKEVIGATA